MEEKDILLFDEVASEVVLIRNRLFERFNNINSCFLDQVLANKIVLMQFYQKEAKSFVSKFLELKRKSVKQNELTSSELNIFRIFGVGETMHSYLISILLDPNGRHGQGHLFLNLFLDALRVKRFSENENWIVTAEIGRIDILLKRAHPHAVIVIENKSNFASDQENQLYRYWYQEIHNAFVNSPLTDEYYQLIYLSPANWKKPIENSLLRPLNWDKNLPEIVPLKLKILLFEEFIVLWLQKSLEKLPKENHRIQEHVKQYLGIWNK